LSGGGGCSSRLLGGRSSLSLSHGLLLLKPLKGLLLAAVLFGRLLLLFPDPFFFSPDSFLFQLLLFQLFFSFALLLLAPPLLFHGLHLLLLLLLLLRQLSPPHLFRLLLSFRLPSHLFYPHPLFLPLLQQKKLKIKHKHSQLYF
jgi:hypothetical protein